MSVYQRNMERGFVITARRRTREVIDITSVVLNNIPPPQPPPQRGHTEEYTETTSQKSGYNFKKKRLVIPPTNTRI